MTFILDRADDLYLWSCRWLWPSTGPQSLTLKMNLEDDLYPWSISLTYILDLAVKLPADYPLYYSYINDPFISWNVAEDLAICSLLWQFFLLVVFQPIVAWFLKVEGVLFLNHKNSNPWGEGGSLAKHIL